LHSLEHVRGAPGVEAAQDLDLVVLGQLLEDVGELVVVEGGGDLGPPLLAQSWMMSARSATRRSP